MVILLVGLGALVLVGVFATQLANESWDKVQEEVRKEVFKQVSKVTWPANKLALQLTNCPGG